MHHKILLGPGTIYEFFGRKLKDIKIMVLKIEIIGDMDVCTSYI